MGERIKKLKKIRIHREGTEELLYSMFAVIAIAVVLWRSFDTTIPFIIFIAIFGTAWLLMLNFYRCPIRYFNGETEKAVVAPADGKIVVIEETEENDYFHDKRLMISIFMSPLNVHANWFPVDGKVKFVKHFDGNYHKAWLPKASEENEHADIMIETPQGEEVLVRQIAGARRAPGIHQTGFARRCLSAPGQYALRQDEAANHWRPNGNCKATLKR